MTGIMSLAIVKEGPEPGFAFKEILIRDPAPGEVVIRVELAGICGSDVPVFTGRRKLTAYPTVPGHEFSGTVYEVGDGVTHLARGDRCAVSLVVPCGECRACLVGEETRCPNARFIGFDGIHGAFAEFVVAPAKVVHKIPGDMSFEQGASVDPVASAYRPVKKARITSEDTVVVIGPGPIGLYALQLARVEGARRTIVLGTRASRLAIAERLGADVTVNVSERDPVKEVRALTGAGGTVVIEATGSPAAVPLAVSLAAPGARVALVGIFHDTTSISPAEIVNKEISVYGTLCYTRDEFLHCIDLISTKRVTCEEVITHILPLREMGRALELIHERKAVKVLVKP